MYIDYLSPISFEAAKLLGVPFTFEEYSWAFKFVYTNDGPVLYSVHFTDVWEHWQPEEHWHPNDLKPFVLYRVRGWKGDTWKKG